MGDGHAAPLEGLQDHGRDQEPELVRRQLQGHHLLQPRLLLPDAERATRLQQVSHEGHRICLNQTGQPQGAGPLSVQLERESADPEQFT